MAAPVMGPSDPVERAAWMVAERDAVNRRHDAECVCAVLVCCACAYLHYRGVRYALVSSVVVLLYSASRLWLAWEGRRRAGFPGEGGADDGS